jgi:hypothetical protein
MKLHQYNFINTATDSTMCYADIFLDQAGEAFRISNEIDD